mgnify:CR=1 FL=1
MILCKASQTAISKAVCYKTKNEQLREKAVHFLLVAINCFYADLPTVFCTITEKQVVRKIVFVSIDCRLRQQ